MACQIFCCLRMYGLPRDDARWQIVIMIQITASTSSSSKPKNVFACPGTRHKVAANSTPASVDNAFAALAVSRGFETMLGRLIETATKSSPIRAADALASAEKKTAH